MKEFSHTIFCKESFTLAAAARDLRCIAAAADLIAADIDAPVADIDALQCAVAPARDTAHAALAADTLRNDSVGHRADRGDARAGSRATRSRGVRKVRPGTSHPCFNSLNVFTERA
jgi:hypothetical protein